MWFIPAFVLNIPVIHTSSTHKIEAISAISTIRLTLFIVIAYAQPEIRNILDFFDTTLKDIRLNVQILHIAE